MGVMREFNPEKPSYFSEHKEALDTVADGVEIFLASGDGQEAIGRIEGSEITFMADPDLQEVITESLASTVQRTADRVAFRAAEVLRPRRPWNRLTLPDPIEYGAAEVRYRIANLNRKVYYEVCKVTLSDIEADDSVVGYHTQIISKYESRLWEFAFVNGECVRARGYEVDRRLPGPAPRGFEGDGQQPTAEELDALSAILCDL